MPVKRKATQAPGAATLRRSKRLHDRAVRAEQQSERAQAIAVTTTNSNTPLPDTIDEQAGHPSINSDRKRQTVPASNLQTISSRGVDIAEIEDSATRLDHAVQPSPLAARLSALPRIDTRPEVGLHDAATAPHALPPLTGTSRIRPVLKFTGRAGSKPHHPAAQSGNEQLSAQIQRNLNCAKLNGLDPTTALPTASAPAPAPAPITPAYHVPRFAAQGGVSAVPSYSPSSPAFATRSPVQASLAVSPTYSPSSPAFATRSPVQASLAVSPTYSPSSPVYYTTRSAARERLPVARAPAIATTRQAQTANDARGAGNNHLSEEDWHKYIVMAHQLACAPPAAVNAESTASPAPHIIMSHDQSTVIIDDDETLSISDIEDQY